MRVRIAIAGTVIGTAAGITISRAVRWWRTWGHDPLEAARALPGDDLVPTPTAIDTRGITIDAPPEAVWPWLVQMGYDRAGWYSYDRMDIRGTSAQHLIPGMPELKVGDLVPTAPDSGFEVRVLDPGKALTLYLDTAIVAAQAEAAAAHATRPEIPAGLAASSAILRTTPPDFAASWTFVLEPLDGGRTRFIERFRVRFGAGGPAFRVVAPAMGFGVFVMMQRQMLGLKERAVRTVVAPPVVAPPHPKSNGRATEPATLTEVVVAAT